MDSGWPSICRFIPAWAGNALPDSRRVDHISVHPRVGGERTETKSRTAVLVGSSPRGRGTLEIGPAHSIFFRFIPAWAGNASCQSCPGFCGPVHPRVGGERLSHASSATVRNGSSPRGRGTPARGQRPARLPRFIPAWAGNAPDKALKPRISSGSSPRGRGTRKSLKDPGMMHRFIPAWAGNAISFSCPKLNASVHPRVGGERPLRLAVVGVEIGSSPRGRGTPATP